MHEAYDCPRRVASAQHEGLFAEPADTTARHPPPEGAAASRTYQPPLGSNYGLRRFLLLQAESSRLTHDDATACRNIELWEAGPSTTDSMGSRISAGTVGLRCIHCIGDPNAADGNATFPRCVDEIADCLRQITEVHMWCCERAPMSVKQILGQAVTQRQLAKQEGGQRWFMEENSRRLLMEHCARVARDLALVNNHPTNTGVMFQPPARHHRDPVSLPRRYSSASAAPMPAPQPRHPGEHIPVSNQQQMSNQPMTSPARHAHDPSEPVDVAFGSPQFGSPLRKDGPPTIAPPEPLPLAPGFPSPASGRTRDTENMPVNFPFVREPSGHWVCKFCQHLPIQHRDANFQWPASNNSPPPPHYIDQHLRVCRMHPNNAFQPLPSPHNLPFPYPPPPQQQQDRESQAGGAPLDFGQFSSSPYAAFTGRSSQPSQEVTVDTPFGRAMAYLEANDLSGTYNDGSPVPDQLKLVIDEDRFLLTSYYYYLMKQLRHCQFAESDRKTRGGKRDAVEIGYGGIQCVHCARNPNARKFFWGSVDRLANSFAEIPTHILKCRACPRETQDALLNLKEKHSEEMTARPRGSQKVYFRRMWRRIHERDPVQRQEEPRTPPFAAGAAAPANSPPFAVAAAPTNSPPAAVVARPERLDPFTTEKLTSAMNNSPGGGSEESVLPLVERSATEGAKALADSAIQAGPPSPSSRVLLSIPNDKEWLSDNDIFIRRQIEVFCATREDVDSARAESKNPIEEGTVGFRCIHCALAKQGGVAEGGTQYPFSINGIYEAVRDIHRVHMEKCKNAPPTVRSKLAVMHRDSSSSLISVTRNYFVTSAKSLGLMDTKDGIRASGQSVPVSSRAAFTFSEPNLLGLPEDADSATPEVGLTPRKRAHSEPSPRSTEGENKRQAQASDVFAATQASGAEYGRAEQQHPPRTARGNSTASDAATTTPVKKEPR